MLASIIDGGEFELQCKIPGCPLNWGLWGRASMIARVNRTPSPYGESNFCHSTHTELPLLCSLVELQGISNRIFQNSNRSMGLETCETEM